MPYVARYLVKKSGVESGPYSKEQILSQLEKGALSSSDLVCFARRWRWLGHDTWFPVEWLRHPPRASDIRIPLSTGLLWAFIWCLFLALLIIFRLRK